MIWKIDFMILCKAILTEWNLDYFPRRIIKKRGTKRSLIARLRGSLFKNYTEKCDLHFDLASGKLISRYRRKEAQRETNDVKYHADAATHAITRHAHGTSSRIELDWIQVPCVFTVLPTTSLSALPKVHTTRCYVWHAACELPASRVNNIFCNH